MTKPKVLLLGTIDHEPARKEYQALSEYVDLIEPKSTSREDFIKEAKSGALDGTLAIYRTFSSSSITGRVDEELVSALPKSLKFICHNGAGYDQIDVHACTAHKIHVSHTPDAVDDATADNAVFLILGALRNFNQPLLNLRKGHWRGKSSPLLGHDPQGKTLGILGMGGIGRNMAHKMQAFGMKIIYHNRRRLEPAEEGGARYVEFDKLLGESDVLSLNLPLNPQTRHTISKPQFQKMKHGIIIINTARGAVIDETALVEALKSGVVSSVGLDVYEDEPEIHPGLVKNEKVLLLPHMGTWTVETQTMMERLVVKNVRSAVLEKRLVTRVGEQAGVGYEA